MKLLANLLILAGVALPACSVYGPDLFLDAGSGGSSGGNVSVSGGTGNVGTGGGSGGVPTSGGAPSGGGTGQTGGVGGEGPSSGLVLVDDLEKGPEFLNGRFQGSWDRFIDESVNGGIWTAAGADEMIEEDPDDADNHAFHVDATGFKALSWGLGVYVWLNKPASVEPIDISMYEKLVVRVRGSSSTARTLRVAIEDEPSRTTAVPCPEEDCVPHAPLGSLSLDENEWNTVEFDLTSARVPAFDRSMAYAIHFTIDPPDSATTVDFWIDDIAFVAAEPSVP